MDRAAAVAEFYLYLSVSCQTPSQSTGKDLLRRSWRRRRNTIADPSVGITFKHWAKHCSPVPFAGAIGRQAVGEKAA
jgi:hypothetical protein